MYCFNYNFTIFFKRVSTKKSTLKDIIVLYNLGYFEHDNTITQCWRYEHPHSPTGLKFVFLLLLTDEKPG